MSARIIPLHRGGYASARPGRESSPVSAPAYLQIDGQQLPIRTFADIRDEAIRHRPDLYQNLAEHIQREPYRPTRFGRVCNWLGRTFDESPRGFAFFVGLLFPICAAAFCVGYFGLRELLAVLS